MDKVFVIKLRLIDEIPVRLIVKNHQFVQLASFD